MPGSPDASRLYQRVTSRDPQLRMPPAQSTKQPLSADEIARIRRWISEGAAYEPHWAFVPPKRPAIPAVRDAGWCRSPVDRFILRRMEEAGITPSPEAGRAALIRRAFLDLTGLPPTPVEIDAFVADSTPDAFERWIDRLLHDEPYRTRYAERMTVPWLDAARYADTCGIHTDAGRQVWLWRDWVLNAFRTNMPFDRFAVEQLAGDLLPGATEDQKIASGFNRNHVTTDEGGAIAEEYIVEYAVDRANTTGSVFLGLTVGCARCHDHKYDPISQQDYYGLYAFFNSIDEPGLYSQLPDPNRAHEPFLVVGTPAQKAEVGALEKRIARLNAELEAGMPAVDKGLGEFEARTAGQAGLTWPEVRVAAAASKNGAILATQPDGSVLAAGANPERDEHVITFRTAGGNLRALLLEAMADPSLPEGRLGRAANGNAVITKIEVDAASIAEPRQHAAVPIGWAWADVEQANGDWPIVNTIDGRPDRGWALDGHGRAGGRVALLLADKPFGFEAGTEVRVRLRCDSIYAAHVPGRIRVRAGHLDEGALKLLPVATGRWQLAGPFPVDSARQGYDRDFGPERDLALDPGKNFGFGNQAWHYVDGLRDEQLNRLADGTHAVYIGRHLYSPTTRTLELSFGSDDGFVAFLNGRKIACREVARAVSADQDQLRLDLQAGRNTLVIKIVNHTGPGGFYYRALAEPDRLNGDLVAALVPAAARSADLQKRLRSAWQAVYRPDYRERLDAIALARRRMAEIEAASPRTMVMKELPQPRPTFVLTRGQYDKPDRNQPVTRAVPAALGSLPGQAPRNRLGLAQWMVSPDNPLVARVAVNRMWEMLFGTGLVRSTEDFGLQGEWPSHPELLDWLAVEFRESGWDVQRMLKLMMASSVYRQDSRVRPEIRECDGDDRLLGWFPRRRLAAEFVRDQALYVGGLLVEALGGPSVKPYQPEGLWPEVAMVQSNTRNYVRGSGADLWRRSLYTYWKRACPPPSLMTFDAPTRESCTIRRVSTSTPLQALVLWNDEQYVEAARALAQRTIRESSGDDDRLARMFRRCTGRNPRPAELKPMRDSLVAFRQRYAGRPEDARRLLRVGASQPAPDIDAAELAAWTMIGNAVLNLSATVMQE